jgi:hypothetical protein
LRAEEFCGALVPGESSREFFWQLRWSLLVRVNLASIFPARLECGQRCRMHATGVNESLDIPDVYRALAGAD